MASPHVTGVVALVRTYYPEGTFTYQQLIERILVTARRPESDSLRGFTATGGVVNAAAALDCNNNGVRDDCDIDCNAAGCGQHCGGSNDCNGNLLPDECEADCNGNGIEDGCDIANCAGDPACGDCDGNGVPDGCEDCDGNGQFDPCEIASDPTLDSEPNGFLDVCQATLSVPSQYSDIQSAIDAASDGDTVLVAAGTYTGDANKNLDLLGKVVTVRCETVGACTIDCQDGGRGLFLRRAETQKSIFEGFKIIRGNPPNPGGGAYLNGSSLTIRNCSFIDNNAGASTQKGGGIAVGCGAPTITDCVIADNSAKGGGGIACTGGSPSITNCTIADNVTVPSLNGGGIRVESPCYPTIDNSILWGNTRLGGTPDQISDPGANATVTYSDVEGGWTGTGNIDADPRFADPALGDYHLTMGTPISPCIDFGNPAFDGSGRVDMDGGPRVFDIPAVGTATVDMGADEFNDCNENNVSDHADIAGGANVDCNENAIPDVCDIDPADPDANGEVSPDCNDNDIPDECDLDSGTSQDCNANEIPDECESDFGACCPRHGSCFDTLESCCVAQGSTWRGGGGVVCADDPGPPVPLCLQTQGPSQGP